MKVLFRPAAAADVEDAHNWYRRQRAGLDEEFLASVHATLERVRENPTAYPIVYRETRRTRLRRFPYSLFYRIYENHVIVIACMHARREPMKWKSRLDG